MTKTLISSIAAATLVGSIGLAYAQSQGSDTYSQPAQTTADTTTSSATAMDETTTPSGPVAGSSSSSLDSSTSSSSVSDESSSLDAQADRN